MTGVVIDTSAVVAILTLEHGAVELTVALEDHTPRLLAAPTLVELGIVFEARYGPAGGGVIERFVRESAVEISPCDRRHADRALDGWRRYGRGRHPAALNLGDCFSYGLATLTGYPLLCTGDDFAATDISVIRPPARR